MRFTRRVEQPQPDRAKRFQKNWRGAHKHITNLEKKRLLDRVHNRSRSIDALPPGAPAPATACRWCIYLVPDARQYWLRTGYSSISPSDLRRSFESVGALHTGTVRREGICGLES